MKLQPVTVSHTQYLHEAARPAKHKRKESTESSLETSTLESTSESTAKPAKKGFCQKILACLRSILTWIQETLCCCFKKDPVKKRFSQLTEKEQKAWTTAEKQWRKMNNSQKSDLVKGLRLCTQIIAKCKDKRVDDEALGEYLGSHKGNAFYMLRPLFAGQGRARVIDDVKELQILFTHMVAHVEFENFVHMLRPTRWGAPRSTNLQAEAILRAMSEKTRKKIATAFLKETSQELFAYLAKHPKQVAGEDKKLKAVVNKMVEQYLASYSKLKISADKQVPPPFQPLP